MKRSINSLIILMLFGLIAANIFLFYSSIKISDEISVYEQRIQKVHHENINLEKDLARLSSLQYAQKLASNLKFSKISRPSYIEKLVYAFNPNQ